MKHQRLTSETGREGPRELEMRSLGIPLHQVGQRTRHQKQGRGKAAMLVAALLVVVLAVFAGWRA